MYEDGDLLVRLLVGGTADEARAFHNMLFNMLFGMDGERHSSLVKAPKEKQGEAPHFWFDCDAMEEQVSSLIHRYFVQRHCYFQVEFPEKVHPEAWVRVEDYTWFANVCNKFGAEFRPLPLDCPAIVGQLDFDFDQKQERENFLEVLENAREDAQQAAAKEAAAKEAAAKEAAAKEAAPQASSQNSDSPKNVDPLNAMIHAHFDSLGELLKKFERKGALAMYAWIMEKAERDDYTVKDRKNLRLLAGQMLGIIEGRYGK